MEGWGVAAEVPPGDVELPHQEEAQQRTRASGAGGKGTHQPEAAGAAPTPGSSPCPFHERRFHDLRVDQMQEHPRHHGAHEAGAEEEQRGRPGLLSNLEQQPEQQRQYRDVDELDAVVIQERRRDQRPQRPREVRCQIRNPVDKGPDPLLIDPVLAALGLRQRHEQRPGDHEIEQHEPAGQKRSPNAHRASSRAVGPRPARGESRSPRPAWLLPVQGTRPDQRPDHRPREERDQQVSHIAPLQLVLPPKAPLHLAFPSTARDRQAYGYPPSSAGTAQANSLGWHATGPNWPEVASAPARQLVDGIG